MEYIKLSSVRKLKEDMQGLSKLNTIKNEDLRRPQKYKEMISLEDSSRRMGMLDNRGCMGKR